MNMTGLIVDFYDDAFASVLVDDDSALEKVGSVEPLSMDQIEDLPDRDFALILADGTTKFRKFACHEPGHVKLSMHYFGANRHKLHPEAQKTAAFFMKRACDRFEMDIPEIIQKTASGFRANTNVVTLRDAYRPPVFEESKSDIQKLDDRDFAFVAKEGAYKVRKYPMRKGAHIQGSIKYFVSHMNDHKPGDRVKISKALMKRASELHVDLEDELIKKEATELTKMATCSFSPDLWSYVQVRKGLVESQESRATLDEMYEKRAEYGDENFVAMLSKFDEIEGLDRHYNHGLRDPWDATFSIEKRAEQVEYMEGSRSIGVDMLRSISPEIVSPLFGSEAGDKWASDPIETFKGLSDAGKDALLEAVVRSM